MTGARGSGTSRTAKSGGLASAWRARLLLVEDEPALAELLDRTLRVAGFDSQVARSRREALDRARDHEPELALVDVMLPDGSGFELCHQLRDVLPDLAVIFVTAKDTLADKITGLDLGGDDYITKPFSVAEVVSRVNAVLRRVGGGQSDQRGRRVLADLILDEDAHIVMRGNQSIELSPTEFRLLQFLLENAGRVMSKQQILANVWNYDFPGDPGVVEKFVSQLRKKLDDGRSPLLHTIRGFGYVMREAP